jgi:hypothetical protein
MVRDGGSRGFLTMVRDWGSRGFLTMVRDGVHEVLDGGSSYGFTAVLKRWFVTLVHAGLLTVFVTRVHSR